MVKPTKQIGGESEIGASKSKTDESIEDLGYYLLMDEISQESCSKAMEWILKANLNRKRLKELTLIVSSYGGEVTSGFALIDTIKGSAIPVRTVGLGVISSCGLLIFLAGTKGTRTITPNTSILSHQWAWGCWGKEHELFARSREFELMTERILNHYQKCTGLSESQVRKHLLPPEDRWLSAKEAMKLNLCDVVKETY